MKLTELLSEEKYEPHPAFKSSGLKRKTNSSMAELDGESTWDLGDDLEIHVINAGRTASVYFKALPPDGARGGEKIKKTWLMPVSRSKEDFVNRYPWLENMVGKSSFDISKSRGSDLEDWINLWKNRKQ